MVWESWVSALLGTPRCAAPCVSGRCWLGSGTDLWGLPRRFVREPPAQVAGAVPPAPEDAQVHGSLPSFGACSSCISFPGDRPEVVRDLYHQLENMGEPLNWQVPETPVVGLMDGSGFPGWPAQLWLGRCGIKRLVRLHAAFWPHGEGKRVLLCTGGLVQLCLGACQRLKCRCWGIEPAGDVGSCLSQLSQKVPGVKTTLKTSLSVSFEGPFCKPCPFRQLPLGCRGIGTRTRTVV